MEALHIDWQRGMPARGAARIDAEQARRTGPARPQAITAVLLGLDSRIATFAVQRAINEYRGEPLLAILPGVALQELWSLMGTAEQALLLVSACVVLVGLVGMLTALLASLGERRREMAILRSVGARPLAGRRAAAGRGAGADPRRTGPGPGAALSGPGPRPATGCRRATACTCR